MVTRSFFSQMNDDKDEKQQINYAYTTQITTTSTCGKIEKMKAFQEETTKKRKGCGEIKKDIRKGSLKLYPIGVTQ